MFIGFCDEAFSDLSCGGDGELTNYQMFQAIIQKRSESRDSDEEEEEEREKTFLNIEVKEYKKAIKETSKKAKRWPEKNPVVFNFRMPSDTQKCMLFEQIHFLIDQARTKRHSLHHSTLRTSDAKDLRYVDLIADIRRAFFSGLSCAQRNVSPHMTQSGGSSNTPSVVTVVKQ